MQETQDFITIHSYTRAQALEDGMLIDITPMAKEAGFKHPTAISANLYHNYIVPSIHLAEQGQSIEGRLWDVLAVFRGAALRAERTTVSFTVRFQMQPSPGGPSPKELVTIRGMVHPGDAGEPVITILIPGDE